MSCFVLYICYVLIFIFITMSYYKDQDFCQFLKIQSIYKRPEQMKGYIDSIRNNILVPLSCNLLIDDIGNIIRDTKYRARLFDGLKLVYQFISDITSLANANNAMVLTFISNYNLNINSLQAWNGILLKYIDFLKEQQIPTSSNQYRITPWNRCIDIINNEFTKIYSTNGIDSLLNKYNNSIDAFVKDVIENSYFFSPDLVQSSFDDIIRNYPNSPLFARKSTDNKVQDNGYFLYTDENTGVLQRVPIILDKNGNRAVVDLIKKDTGYLISSGKDSNFQNYIISHVWGDAFDPRNFTNFWNIVIVPAWGNFLLDKTNATDELTLKMINTFKAICLKKYQMSNWRWRDIGKSYKNLRPDLNHVVKGDFKINVILERKNNQPFSLIKKYKVNL